jgi:AraC family transcriptional regulator of arabinose operon
MEQLGPVNAEKLATEVELSVSRLQHLFKHQTGRTLKQYRKGLVLRKAAQLLSGTFLPIKRIASECGYRSPVNFTQDFRHRFGKSPRQCRIAGFTKK